MRLIRLCGDDVRAVWTRDLAKIGEDVWQRDEEEGKTFLGSADERPGWREEQGDGASEEAKEEKLVYGQCCRFLQWCWLLTVTT